jgi:dTDP-4-amino-4,6-dideoxygalactose transaminase
MEWKLRLTEPEIGIEEIAAVTRVLESKWLTMGPETSAFEREFAGRMDVKHAFAVTNCTAALHLAYLATGVGPGDEVICPSLTFVATANAARYTGARVVFAGVLSQDDLTIDPADIEAKITPRTKAIAVMHYGGFPCRMDEILTVARRHKLPVVEDCAHSPFAWIRAGEGRRYTGSIGSTGCFSFFGNKNMTTGEGGMITTNDDAVATEIKLLRSHGMTTLTYDRDRGHAGQYDVVELGHNYRIDEIRSAIGRCQLARIDALNSARREVFRWYREALEGVAGVHVPFSNRDVETSSCHIMTVLVETALYPQVSDALREAGIQTSRHYELITNFTQYEPRTSREVPCQGWELMTLPLGPRMTRSDVLMVTDCVRRAVARNPETTEAAATAR